MNPLVCVFFFFSYFYTSTQFALSVCLGPMQRSNSPFLRGSYLRTSWRERLSRMTLNLCQNSTVRAWIILVHSFVISKQKTYTRNLLFLLYVIKLDACTMTPWFLSATSRISQISQSGCASPKGTLMITASCTARRHLQEKVQLRYDVIIHANSGTSWALPACRTHGGKCQVWLSDPQRQKFWVSL